MAEEKFSHVVAVRAEGGWIVHVHAHSNNGPTQKTHVFEHHSSMVAFVSQVTLEAVAGEEI